MYYLKNKKKKSTAKRKVNYIDKLDKVFSKFIRLRDASPSGLFKCISCGKIKPIEQADCGHYFSRRHMNTRYDEKNCHAECRACNRFDAEHLIGYRENLIQKIGIDEYNKLSVRVNLTYQWSDFEIKELIKYYTARAELLKRQKGINL